MNYIQLRALLANPAELADVYAKTEFLGSAKTIPIRRRLWHIDNNIYIVPACQTCAIVDLKWTEKTSEYRRFCSSKCAQHSDEVRDKRENTCIEKYGYSSNLLSPANQSQQKLTCIKKYGVDNFAKSPLFVERVASTCLAKYGVSNPAMLQEVKDKADATNFARYGRKRQSQMHIPLDIIALKNDEAVMREWFFDKKMPVSEISEILNVNHAQLCYHFTNNLKIDITRHTVSSQERKVGEFLTSLGVEFESSNRKIIAPKELDIVVPSYNIALELNGIAWHGERLGKDNKYHLNKMIKCNEQNIRLVQILDIEWNTKQEIVKSRISSMLDKNNTIGARKCDIREIDAKLARLFFDECHIQGYSAQSVAYGLFADDVLVAAMSFCKSRYNKKYEWELLRYSNCLYTSVVGGAGKLFAHFKKMHVPESVISYCDLRWNTGTVYNKIGFTQTGQSAPNYWYTKSGKLYSRIKFQKHKLSAMLERFDPDMTEWGNMLENGYDRIWDCGNLVFSYTK